MPVSPPMGAPGARRRQRRHGERHERPFEEPLDVRREQRPAAVSPGRRVWVMTSVCLNP